jgi:hypothetical protein
MTLFNDSLMTKLINLDGKSVKMELNYRLIEQKDDENLFLEITREDDLFWLLVHEVHPDEFAILKSE